MKKLFIFVILSYLLSIPILADGIDYDKLQLVDEIFIQHEYIKLVEDQRREFYSQPRRGDPRFDRYAKTLEYAYRKLFILVNFYEMKYREKFYDKWDYESWQSEKDKMILRMANGS